MHSIAAPSTEPFITPETQPAKVLGMLCVHLRAGHLLCSLTKYLADHTVYRPFLDLLNQEVMRPNIVTR